MNTRSKISDSYKTTVDGNHLKITVGEGSILFVDMAGKNININGKTIKSGEENSTVEPVPPPEFPTLPATLASPIIYGTEGDDTIENDKDFAVIQALGGNDYVFNSYRTSLTVIYGNEGNDSIYNDGKFVTINTSDGDDSIYNGGDNVTITTGADNDSIENQGKDVIIRTEAENDYVYTYMGSNVTVAGGNGNDSIISWNNNNISINGGNGNDFIKTGDNSTSVTINGGNDDDTIYAIGDSLTINGDEGNDSIHNEQGDNNLINGGTGNDSIYNSWNSYDVTINGGDGDDSIVNDDTSSNTLNGDNGNDYISNWNGDYISIDSGDGDDTIESSSYVTGRYVTGGRNVTIKAGTGNDSISLSTYSYYSLIVYNYADGNDIINGFNSTSTLSISGSSYSTQVSNNDIIITVGDNSITLAGAADLDEFHIDGEEENLTNLTFNNKTDSKVTLPAQTETVDVSERTKPIRITGNTLANSLFGGTGNDTLDGTEGNNTLTGGKGKDSFIYNGGNDIITDYEKGKDKISLDSASISTFTTINKDVIFTLSNNNSLTLNNMVDKQISFLSGSKTTKITFTSNASLDGSEKGATLIPATTEFSAVNYSKLVTINAENVSSAVNIIGNNKANRIIAGNHGSTLNGGKGKDSLYGGDDTDIFVYNNNSGNKTFVDYTMGDTISLVGSTLKDASVKSNDDVIFKVGNKKITIKGAADSTITFIEDDTIKTFSGGVIYDSTGTSAIIPARYKYSAQKIFDSTISYINASNAKKKLYIVASATDGSTIESGKGNDTLIGGSGNDYILGGKGKDILRGGAGADSLWGGKGNDTLYGGDDDDTFVFYAGEGNDVIADYASGDMLQIMNKKGTGYADFKKATFKDETLTLNINGGGKLILSGVNGDAFVNINGENNKISSLLK